jgi:hypothetical protein
MSDLEAMQAAWLDTGSEHSYVRKGFEYGWVASRDHYLDSAREILDSRDAELRRLREALAKLVDQRSDAGEEAFKEAQAMVVGA